MSRTTQAEAEEDNYPPTQYNLESYLGQQPVSPPERYPLPSTHLENEEDATYIGSGFQSIEEKKEFLAVTRNTIDILSSILNSDNEPKPLKDDLTISMLEKCKQSLPVIQRIIESTSDDEVMLFDALNLHDELQLVISKYGEVEAALESQQLKDHNTEPSTDSSSNEATLLVQSGSHSPTGNAPKVSRTSSNKSSRQEESADKSSQGRELIHRVI